MSRTRRIARPYIGVAVLRQPALLLALAVPSPALAETGELVASASARIRGEAIAGSFRAGGPAHEEAVLTRLNLFAEYDAGPIRVGGELQDARALSRTPGGSANENAVNALEPIQAYVVAGGDAARVRLGRFTLDLGSRRLVARPNFRNTSTSFSGARLDLGGDEAATRATFVWVLPQARLPDDEAGIAANRVALDRERTGLQLFGGVVTRKGVVGGTAELSGFRLYERDAPGIATRDRRLWIASLRHVAAPAAGRIDHDLEAAVEGGSALGSAAAGDRDRRRVSAGFMRAQLGYSWPGGWRPRVQLAFDYVSGDRRGRTIGRFDTLFGDSSFEFGPTSLYGLVARANLLSAEARVELRPDAASDALLAIRPLWLASATDTFGNSGVRDPAGASGRYAGTQIEGRLRRWIVQDRLRLSAGGAYLAKGRFLRTAPNAPPTGDSAYGYLELSLDL